MNKSLVRRIRKIEKQTLQPRWRVVVKDYDGLYCGECGQGLSQEQFDAWVKAQDKDTQVIIVEVCENISTISNEKESVTFKVENHIDKNLQDTLHEYDEVLEKSSDSYLPHTNIDEYSEQEKNSILEAHRIIRQHHPIVPVERMH